MIKRTLFFGNPAYLKCKNDQIEIETPSINEKTKSRTVPIEDVGLVVLDDPQLTISHHLIHKLLENNVALVTSNDKHMPVGLMLNLDGNTLQQERFEAQISASLPIKKQMWSQTIEAKITNQAMVLKSKGIKHDNMLHWASSVKSGDSENHEARAAAYYWQSIFSSDLSFKREREGNYPNNLLNYGYAILRAIVARSLVGSGLLPTLGIHHHNRYNAYCLADDIMEPYRPFVDILVLEIMKEYAGIEELSKEMKAKLLSIATVDVTINGQNSPLLIATQLTTSSVAKCYSNESRKIMYPEM
jgi:CRISPR-associated protein Cas1